MRVACTQRTVSLRKPRGLVACRASTQLPAKFSTVKPSGDRVLIRTGSPESKTRTGILLPAASETDKTEGEVVAVGEVKTLKEGAHVVYSRYAGTKVKVGDVEHVLMKEADVIGSKGDKVTEMQPTEDRVLIRVAEEDARSVGGVILTAQSSDRPTVGDVVAVGPGATGEDGVTQPVKCAVGQQVLYSKYAGVELEEGDVHYVVVRESDVLAVLA